MRERLVAALVGLTLAVLVLFGVPRAYQVGGLVRDQEQRTADRSAGLAAVVVGDQQALGRPVTPALLDRLVDDAVPGGERIVYTAPGGDTVASSTPGPSDDSDDLEAVRDVPGGGTLTLVRSAEVVQDRVSEALLPLVLIILALLALSVVLGLVLARRLARPFQQLAEAARRLGTGEPVVDVPPSGIPEVEQIGEAVRSSAVRLEELRRHERDLAVHASHELRTPVTALRLELEDLALWPQTAPEVADQLHTAVAELDRLSAAIARLLDRSAEQRRGSQQDVDLEPVVAALVAERSPAAAALGCPLQHQPGGGPPAHVDPVTLRRLLGTVLDRIVVAGRGAGLGVGAGGISVRVLAVESHPEVEVTVEPAGVGPDARSALGRAVAPTPEEEQLARALGGRATSLSDGRCGVVVRLPGLDRSEPTSSS